MSGEYNVPVVDFTSCALTNETLDLTDDLVKKTVDRMVDGLREFGCVYLVNHGVRTDELKQLRSTSSRFFDLAKYEKLKCIRKAEDGKNGWVAMEMEYFSDPNAGDLKECFSINLPSIDEFPWPDDSVIPGFRDVNRNFMVKLNALTMRLCRLLGSKLSPNDTDVFVRAHKDLESPRNNSTCMRHLYYPPLPQSDDRPSDQQRLAAHTDYGIFTLLLQDHVGGLEFQARDGLWYDAVPLEGAILVQAADLLEIWTAGFIKATYHRVRLPGEDQRGQVRESTVYFVQPDDDVLVQCLDGSNAYPATTSLDHLCKRIAASQPANEDVRDFVENST